VKTAFRESFDSDSVAYDCRIVFAKQKHPKTGAEVLLLVNLGTHDEVY